MYIIHRLLMCRQEKKLNLTKENKTHLYKIKNTIQPKNIYICLKQTIPI